MARVPTRSASRLNRRGRSPTPCLLWSPVQIGAFVNPAAPAGTRWTGNNVILFADQIQLLLGVPRPLEIFYLRGNGSTWRGLFDGTNVAGSPILGATGLILIRRVNADGAFRIPPPFVP